jgi:hypothetical protein
MGTGISGMDYPEENIAKDRAEGPDNVVALTYAATTALEDPSIASIQTITLTGNVSFTFPAPGAGKEFDLYVVQDATGSRTGSYTSPSGSVLFVGGSKTLTITANAVDHIAAQSDGTNWYCRLDKAYA